MLINATLKNWFLLNSAPCISQEKNFRLFIRIIYLSFLYSVSILNLFQIHCALTDVDLLCWLYVNNIKTYFYVKQIFNILEQYFNLLNLNNKFKKRLKSELFYNIYKNITKNPSKL